MKPKDDLPVPREMYMKLTNPEKTYVKNRKGLPESAKRRFNSTKAEGSDHENMQTEKQYEGSTSGGSKKQKTKGKTAFKAKGSKKFKSKAKNQRNKKVSFVQKEKS